MLEPHRTGAYCTLHTLYPLKRCSWRRLGTVEPPRTRVKEVYIPCYLCEDVVREGSMRFDGLESHQTSAYSTLHTLYPLKRCSWRRFGTVEPPRTRVKEVYIPCYLCEDVVREGSMRFDGLESHQTSAYSPLHTLYPLKRCSWRRFGTVEPPRTRVKEVYIPCYSVRM